MTEKMKPSYWSVIPACVRYDASLPPNAKLLYAEIAALCDDTGYCFASNEYFASNFELGVKSIQRLLKTLCDHSYISVDVVRDPKTNEVLERRIFAGINPAGSIAPPSPQKRGDPSPQNWGDPSPQKRGVEQYNSFNNIPPIVPQGDMRAHKRKRKRKEPRDRPDWKPDRFDGFWKFYPKDGRKDKQRAMDAWDKLSPDDDLIATIARALVKLKATESWKRGIGIPYVSTFLNGARWNDADELDAPSEVSDSGSGWAEDEEVLE